MLIAIVYELNWSAQHNDHLWLWIQLVNATQ